MLIDMSQKLKGRHLLTTVPIKSSVQRISLNRLIVTAVIWFSHLSSVNDKLSSTTTFVHLEPFQTKV